jgi:hypothetical protein
MDNELKEYIENENNFISFWGIRILGNSYENLWLGASQDMVYPLLYSLTAHCKLVLDVTKKLTDEGKEFIPALEYDVDIIKSYIEPSIEEMLRILSDVSERYNSEKRKFHILNEEEYAKITSILKSFLMYNYIRYGVDILREEAVKGGYEAVKEKICKGLEEYEKFIFSIQHKAEYFPESIEYLALVSLINSDIDGTLHKMLKNENIKVIFNEIPKKGIEKTIENIGKEKDEIVKDLRENKPLTEKHSVIEELKRQCDLEERKRYYYQLKKSLGKLQECMYIK